MKVQPIASPHAMQQPQTTNNSSARAKAIAMIAGNPTLAPSQQPPVQVVQDQNNISVEELGAIQAKPPTQGQADDSVDTSLPLEPQVPAPAEPKVETPEETAASRQFAQLARQTKAIRQQQQDLKQREAALQAREDALRQPATPPAPAPRTYTRDEIKRNALATLQDAGVTYEEITQQVMNPLDPRVNSVISELQQEVQALRAEREQERKAQSEGQTQQYQAAIKQITADALHLVKSDPEAYEAITKTGTVKEVTKLIERTFKEEGRIMSVEEAANEVENYLVEENYQMANKIDKIKKRLQPIAASTPAQTPAAAKPPQQPQQMKTLTNATASTRQLGAKERAILAFKGELKS